MGFAGLSYGITAMVGGAIFLALAIQVQRAGDGDESNRVAKFLFGYSILYLFALFAVLLVENRFHALFGAA